MDMKDVDRAVLTKNFLDVVGLIGDYGNRTRGWKQKAADFLGISSTQLSKILHGEREMTPDLAARIAAKTGLRPALFFDGVAVADLPEVEALLRANGQFDPFADAPLDHLARQTLLNVESGQQLEFWNLRQLLRLVDQTTLLRAIGEARAIAEGHERPDGYVAATRALAEAVLAHFPASDDEAAPEEP